MRDYYYVIGAFVVICVASVVYVLLNPKKSFSSMPVIDDNAMLVHNGQSGHQFTQGENTFFQVRSDFELMILGVELDHLKCKGPLYELLG